MASNSESPNREESNPSNDDNPFVAFKKYADEQFAYFFQNFIGLPSSTQLRNLERSYFDEKGPLNSITDFVDKAAEAKDSPLEAKQQVDRWAAEISSRESPFLSFLSQDLPSNAFERWQRQAERQIGRQTERDVENVANQIKVDRYPYRPIEVHPHMSCPFRTIGNKPVTTNRKSLNSPMNAMSLPLLSKCLISENTHLNHYAMHRSHCGITCYVQNIPLCAWPLAYIALSPYSPLTVERELRDIDGNPNMRWRNAFEDLILSHKEYPKEDLKYRNDMEIVDGRVVRPRDKMTTGVEWMWNMFNTGLFGNWRRVDSAFAYDAMNNGKCRFQIGDEQGTNLAWEAREADLDESESEERLNTPLREEEYDDEMTELDLYDPFLNNRNRVSSSNQKSPASIASSKPSSFDPSVGVKARFESGGAPDSSIISTLTTTERQVFPDGTIFTKVILKKRFADGREESNEAEHTTHNVPQAENTASPNNKAIKVNTRRLEDFDNEKEQKPKKGWFW